MNVKAFLKTVGIVSLLLGYIALAAWAVHNGSQLFLAIVLAPIVLIAIVITSVELYKVFKEEDEK